MNIFTEAKKLQKQYPTKAWKDLVKMAGKQVSGKKVFSPSKNKAMATAPKRKAPATRRKTGVGATRVVTRTKVVKANTTRRRSVGAIVDKTMVQVAVGMALTGVVQGVIDPMKGRLPAAVQKFAEPAQVIIGYMISQKAKQPIIKGVGLGIMNNGVQGTVKTIMGMVKGNTMPPAVVVQQPANNSSSNRMTPLNAVGNDFYVALPNTVGYLSGINNSQITANIAGTETCEPGYEQAYETYAVPGANF